MKNHDATLLREHADRCRLLATRVTHEDTIYALTRMADECSELAEGLELEIDHGEIAKV